MTAAIAALWLSGSAATFVLLHRIGPWWRVAAGALALPVLPLVALGHKIVHSLKRRYREGQRQEQAAAAQAPPRR